MTQGENPFTPSFGEIPLYMAGRDAFISALTRALDRQSRGPELTTLISGARGTGKTALLARAAEVAQAHGWICASTTCGVGMLDDLLTQATRAASDIVNVGERSHLTGIGIGQVLNLEWEREAIAPSTWRSHIDDLMGALEPFGTGLLLTVDEVSADVDEMIHLAAIYQHFVSERKRIALLMAGLPYNVESLREDKTVSFVRRAEIQRLGRVSDHDIADALEKTVAQGGRAIDQAACAYAVKAIRGFPFMMQLAGYRIWDQNIGRPTITLDDAKGGTRLAQLELRDRILEPTYRELSDGDLAFLFAMLDDGDDETPMSAIAERLGKSSAYVNTYRRRLLKQGIIGERGRKTVGIDMPMLREYLLEKRAENKR